MIIAGHYDIGSGIHVHCSAAGIDAVWLLIGGAANFHTTTNEY